MWRWSVVIFGFVFLLLSSFLDNLRGPILPQITDSLKLSYSQSSALISVGNFSSMIATLVLALLSGRFANRGVALFALSLSSLACALSVFVDSYPTLIFFAAVLGTAITLLGSMSNILVIEGTPFAKRARVMNALHSLYGFGSLLAALVVAAQVQAQATWSSIFIVSVFILIGILAVAARKIQDLERAASARPVPVRASQLLICIPIVLYVAGEVGCSMWMVTFAKKGTMLAEAEASLLLSGFFGVVGLTRILAFAFCRPGTERHWIRGSIFLSCLCFFASIFISPYLLPLVGIVGPFFPLYVNSISERYPDNWQTIALISFSLMQAMMAIFHHGMGMAMDRIDPNAAYLIPCGFLVASLMTDFWINNKSTRTLSAA